MSNLTKPAFSDECMSNCVEGKIRLAELSLYNGTCPRAHKYSKQLITLPIHLDITKDNCIKIVETIKEIL